MANKRTRPSLFVCKHCQRRFEKLHYGAHTPQFCGGVCRNLGRPTKTKIDKHGYVYTYRSGSTKIVRTQIYEHRVVMERELGKS